ncbi:hypothetical protein KKH27_10930 [bacterium]|nr:hypothetical protein [bacterium]MBU1983956.1 hypothetical protein [bacterium]
MQTLVNYIWIALNSPWISLCGLIIGLLGLLLFLRSKRDKRPCFAQRSTNILTDLKSSFGAIEVTYESQPIQSFTSTRIAFWNEGRETINRADIPSGAPITIRVGEGHRILEVKTVFRVEEANQMDIHISDSEARQAAISFEYLDQDQGGVVEILHTGTSDSDISISGLVKGTRLRKRVLADELDLSIGRICLRSGKAALVVSLLFTLVLLVAAWPIWRQTPQDSHVFADIDSTWAQIVIGFDTSAEQIKHIAQIQAHLFKISSLDSLSEVSSLDSLYACQISNSAALATHARTVAKGFRELARTEENSNAAWRQIRHNRQMLRYFVIIFFIFAWIPVLVGIRRSSPREFNAYF